MDPASSTPLDSQRLLQHGHFLRALARSLVRDEHEADDVVQDTWMRALRHPPQELKTPRAWLARVVHSVVAQRQRSEGRRRRRDEVVGLEALDAQLAEPEEHLESLVLAVTQLEQPYRRSILERYFEGLKPSEIAKRHSVPITTVYSWLKRGLAQLRKRLDERADGSRDRWVRGLTVALGLSRPEAKAAATGLSSATIWLLSGGLMLSVGAVWWVMQRPGDERSATDSTSLTASSTDASASTTRGLAPTRERVEFDEQAPTPVETATADSVGPEGLEQDEVMHRLDGVVLDPEGYRRAHVQLELQPPFPWEDEEADALRTVSDANGEFRFEVPEGYYHLVARDASEPWTVLLGNALPERSATCEVRLQPRLTGQVVDEEGRPRSGLQVTAAYELPFWDPPSVLTDGDGHFHFDELPIHPVHLTVRTADADPESVPMWQQVTRPSASPLQVVLAADERPASIRGRFFGDPEFLADASVRLWSGKDQSQESPVRADGQFHIETVLPGDYELEFEGPRRSWHVVTVELRAGEERDLGRLDLPRISHLSVELDSSTLPDRADLETMIMGGARWIEQRIPLRAGDGPMSAELLPGQYSVSVWKRHFHGGEDAFAAVASVEVGEAGTSLTIPHADLIPLTLNLATLDLDVDTQVEAPLLTLVLGDPQGRYFAPMQFPLTANRQVQLLLSPGEYLFSVDCGGFLSGTQLLQVDDRTRNTVVDLDLD